MRQCHRHSTAFALSAGDRYWMLRGVRLPAACALLLFFACTASPVPVSRTRKPTPPLLERWAAGTSFRTELDRGVPDELPWRAASVWWSEALRQSSAFDLQEDAEVALPVLSLSLDPKARTLAAMLRDGRGERALGGEHFRDGDLPAAIDRLAWACRLALGEDAAEPLPVADATSRDPRAALAVADALRLLRDGGIGAAHAALRDARVRDGGAPFVLDAMAAVAMLRGEVGIAERLASEALGYTARLSPAVQHRLLRTLLLARAALRPDQASRFDLELQRLGEVAANERPHDPQPLLTRGVACNFRGEFAAARSWLEPLLPRLRDQPILLYHLGWACLGSGDPAAAAGHLAMTTSRLPFAATLLPHAIALYESGQHDALRLRLQDLIERDDEETRPLQHDLVRMQAAHALLRSDPAAAQVHIHTDLNWLLKHPEGLERSVGQFADSGAVLVRLGGGATLQPVLAAVQAQHAGAPVSDACAYLGAMVDIASRGGRRADVETALARGGDNVFAALLAAFAHERAGELADNQTWLSRAARLGENPMTKALLARSLRNVGRSEEATQLRTALRHEMRTLRLRTRLQHPLLGPELAFAFLLE